MLRHLLSASLTIVLAAGVAAQSPSPAATVAPSPTPTTLESLNAADLRQAIPIIRETYFDPGALNETELNRAVLAGLLGELGRDVVLLPARSAETGPSPAPFYREVIANHIGYLRLGELSREQFQEMDSTLRGLTGKKIDALILDLRDCAETSDYAMAAAFANCFVPKGSPLFTLRGTGGKEVRTFVADQDPIYRGLLVLLVDSDTAGAVEALAAVLRSCEKTILIGQTTAGRAISYVDRPLPSGAILRIAAAQVILPIQHSRLSNGLAPDLLVPQSAADKRQIFQQSLTKGMAVFVFETDRPHLNEAALLAGTDPEIDAVQAAQQRHGQTGTAPARHDAPLQRAVDLVTSIEIYEKQPGTPP